MLTEIGIKAQKASLQIARLDTELKNKILLDMSEELLNNDIFIEVEKQKYQAYFIEKPLKQSNFKKI